MMRKRFLTFIATASAGLALAGGVAQAGDSTAVAINTKDNSSLVKIVFDITRIVNGHDVTTGNAAVAVSSCNSCQTVAIAIQIVLASGSPTVVVPQNIAVAMNVDCSLCSTLADAYQYVYAGSTRMVFTKAGRKRIKEIQRQLKELEKSNLSVAEIQARIDELTGQIQDVLDTELVPAEHGLDSAGSDTSTTAAPTTTETTPTETTPTETTPTETTPTDTGTSTTPTDTGTGTSTTPTETGTGTGTSTTPTGTGTGTSTTPTDTGTSTTPSG
ncbi:MAG: putative peptide zinc metalloprotease protein [Thermoleophilaceae bacterium]|jgi:putative peptide zinc metalloprotease protein|nr:putative peptide zinc metalloprotease protein [Thermoleophilaceae bacterium]